MSNDIYRVPGASNESAGEDLGESIKITVSDEDRISFKRLDQYLAKVSNGLSRTLIKKLFQNNLITANKKIDLKKMPVAGTEIEIMVPPPIPLEAEAEDIPLEILYEDEHLLFVNKPAGMVTHPAPGNYTGTLVNAILHHCPDLKGIGGVKRPGIVHRLDKGTSGVMVVAKSQAAHEGLVLLFSTHDIERYYEALVIGTDYPAGGKIESTIGRNPQNRLKMKANVRNGKEAITFYKKLNDFDKYSHIELKLETGRTHQIRVHLSQLLGKSILCDQTYGNVAQQMQRVPKEVAKILEGYEYPLLHAKTLGLVHPITKEKLLFTQEPPEVFKKVLEFADE